MDSLYLIIFFILGTVLGGFYTVLGGRLAEEDYHFFRIVVIIVNINFLF